jgi:hypothetical protein
VTSITQLKLTLAEATVQLRILQNGAEHVPEVPSKDVEAIRTAAGMPVSTFAVLAGIPETQLPIPVDSVACR